MSAMSERVDVLDRDARTLYDLASIRAEREDATREDAETRVITLRLWQNLAAVAELVEADREYDAALAAYNACAAVRPWHSAAVRAELTGYRVRARERLNRAKDRRVIALARFGGAS